jgi:hypothetical protein
MHSRRIFCAGLSLIVFVSGCSGGLKDRPPIVPVSGSVKYKGQPVEGAIVTFVTEKSPRTSTGVTDAEGKFQLTTFDTNDGAVVGENLVSIVKNEPAAPDAPKMDPMAYAKAMQSGQGMPKFQPKSTIPAKYADPKSSGLKRTVVEGEVNEFNFDLTD